MTRTPVTLADQGVVIGPEDADELADLLLDASWVIGHLAAVPPAEQACARAPAGPTGCADLAMDLKLAAAALDDAATAGRDNAYLTLLARKAAARRRMARDTPRKGNAPKKGRDNL
jgi:hypothetical protein